MNSKTESFISYGKPCYRALAIIDDILYMWFLYSGPTRGKKKKTKKKQKKKKTNKKKTNKQKNWCRPICDEHILHEKKKAPMVTVPILVVEIIGPHVDLLN